MKTATINKINYTQSEEKEAGSCHGCAGNTKTEEGDTLCRELSKVAQNDCDEFIWEELK